MTLPDAYLIGLPKAGTTSLARWLACHPDVYFSVPKEPFYWATDYPALRRHHGFSSRRSYEQLFASPAAQSARCRLEGSTVYAYSTAAIPDILAASPDAKFILALRNPIDLVVSYHREQLFALNEDETDFLTAWHRSLSGKLPRVHPLDPKLVDYQLVATVGAVTAHVTQLIHPDRLHVILFDDIAATPIAVWQGLTSFLGLSPAPLPDMRVYNPSSKSHRFPRLWRFVYRPPRPLDAPLRAGRHWLRTHPPPLFVELRKRLLWAPSERPSIPNATRAELENYFRPDIQLLGSVLHRDFTVWLPEGGS